MHQPSNAKSVPVPPQLNSFAMGHDMYWIPCYRSRSACACLHTASPLKADRLNEASPRHPLRDEDASAGSLTRVAAISSPLSRSSEPCGIGIAADGDSLLVSAACTCTSSTEAPDGAGWFDVLLPDLAMERTTSPLHIGHVRRRVVSHGVLEIIDVSIHMPKGITDFTHMHSAWNS